MQKRNNSNNNIFHSESQIVVQKIFYFSPNYIEDLVSYWKVYFQTKPSVDVNKNGKFYFLIQWGAGQDLHKKKNWKSLLPNQEITTIKPIQQ